MATITRGSTDPFIEKLKGALEEYEKQHPQAVASLYRESPGSVWIRVLDPSFGKLSKAARHDLVWNFLSDRLDDDTIQEISILLPITPKEAPSNIMNEEFDYPVSSGV